MFTQIKTWYKKKKILRAHTKVVLEIIKETNNAALLKQRVKDYRPGVLRSVSHLDIISSDYRLGGLVILRDSLNKELLDLYHS